MANDYNGQLYQNIRVKDQKEEKFYKNKIAKVRSDMGEKRKIKNITKAYLEHSEDDWDEFSEDLNK